jgi:hypothetical protein
METLPGPTLADTKGERRVRKLRETRANLYAQIKEKRGSIRIIDHEIAQLELEVI